MIPKTSDLEKIWLLKSRFLQRQINLAWWLDKASIPLIILSAVLGMAIPLLRYFTSEKATLWGLSFLTGGFLWVILWSWFKAKNFFESEAQCLVRWEDHLALNSRLSSAHQGVTTWPDIPQQATNPIKWHFVKSLLPVIGGVFVLVFAWWCPIPEHLDQISSSKPRDWQRLDANLQVLSEEELLDQDYVDEMQKKLEQLESQPEEQWYDHSSLEAGKNLMEEHQLQAQQMVKAMEQVNQTLNQLNQSKQAADMSEYNQALQQQLNQAAMKMEKNRMQPNEALRKQLQELSESGLQPLSQEQVQSLRDNMKNLEQMVKEQSGDWSKGQEGSESMAQRETPFDRATGFSREEGGGPTNRELGPEADKRLALNPLRIESKDMSVSLPSELLEISEGEHEVDMTASQSQYGGDTKNVGQGGSTTWKGNYLPEEKRALKNFFK